MADHYVSVYPSRHTCVQWSVKNGELQRIRGVFGARLSGKTWAYNLRALPGVRTNGNGTEKGKWRYQKQAADDAEREELEMVCSNSDGDGFGSREGLGNPYLDHTYKLTAVNCPRITLAWTAGWTEQGGRK